MSWSKCFDQCQACGTTEVRHKGRGLCVRCHWKDRYASDPKFRERVKRNAKNAYLRDPDKEIERVRQFRISNPERVKAWQSKYRKQITDLTGRSHSYPYRIGTAVGWKTLTGLICSRVKKIDGEPTVDVLLPDGSICEEMPIKALQVYGFSIEDSKKIWAELRHQKTIGCLPVWNKKDVSQRAAV
jgi:hypothetical protein